MSAEAPCPSACWGPRDRPPRRAHAPACPAAAPDAAWRSRRAAPAPRRGASAAKRPAEAAPTWRAAPAGPGPGALGTRAPHRLLDEAVAAQVEHARHGQAARVLVRAHFPPLLQPAPHDVPALRAPRTPQSEQGHALKAFMTQVGGRDAHKSPLTQVDGAPTDRRARAAHDTTQQGRHPSCWSTHCGHRYKHAHA